MPPFSHDAAAAAAIFLTLRHFIAAIGDCFLSRFFAAIFFRRCFIFTPLFSPIFIIISLPTFYFSFSFSFFDMPDYFLSLFCRRYHDTISFIFFSFRRHYLYFAAIFISMPFRFPLPLPMPLFLLFSPLIC